MEILNIAALAVVCAMIVSLLKQYAPGFAFCALLGCSSLLLLYLINFTSPIIEWLITFGNSIDGEDTRCILKVTGISVLAQNMQDLCKDSGMNALAGNVELAARCLIVIQALPMFETVIRELSPLLQ